MPQRPSGQTVTRIRARSTTSAHPLVSGDTVKTALKGWRQVSFSPLSRPRRPPTANKKAYLIVSICPYSSFGTARKSARVCIGFAGGTSIEHTMLVKKI